MNMTRILTLLLLMSGVLAPANAGGTDFDKTRAEQLLMAYLADQGYDVKMLSQEPMSQVSPDFFLVEVDHKYDRPGSVVVAAFGINKETGDIWQLVPCRRVSSRSLSALQRAVRRDGKLSAQAWKHYHQLKPDGFC